MCDHLAYGMGMRSWHVGCAWSVSHDGHKRDMGYVTRWASRGEHLAFMSHGGCGYQAQRLGQDGRSLGMDYVIWLLGMWAMFGQLECIQGIDCVTLQALTGQLRRHMIGKIICRRV